MDLANHVRRGEVELIEAAVDEDTARVQHGTHGAIGHNHTAGQLITKFLGAGLDGCSHERWSQARFAKAQNAILFSLTQVARDVLRSSQRMISFTFSPRTSVCRPCRPRYK